MKELIKSGISILSILLLIACGNNENKKKEIPQNKKTSVAITKESEVKINDDLLNAIYSQYTHLTVALTQGNIAEA